MTQEKRASSSVAGSLSCPGCGAAASPSDAACRYCTRALSSVACAECFARLFAGMEYCPGCGSRSVAGHSNAAAQVLACPGCGDHHCTSLLTVRNVSEHALHECLACHGLWIDTDTVNAIASDVNTRALFAPEPVSSVMKPARVRDIAKFRYRRCPHCAKMMARVNVAKISGVIVDKCAEHGTFFDVDELHELVQFLEEGGLDRARTREREALAAERRRLQLLMEVDQRRRALEYSPRNEGPSGVMTELLGALMRRVGT